MMRSDNLGRGFHRAGQGERRPFKLVHEQYLCGWHRGRRQLCAFVFYGISADFVLSALHVGLMVRPGGSWTGTVCIERSTCCRAAVLHGSLLRELTG